MLLASKSEDSLAADLVKLDALKGQFLASSEKNSDQLWKVKDRAKKQAEALRHLEVIEKTKRKAAVLKIVNENKKVMKRISAKHYREMKDCFKKGTDLGCVHEKELRRLNAHHKKVLETVSGSHDVDMRTEKSTISCITNKLDDAMLENHYIILSHNTAVLSEVKDEKSTERNHHSAKMRSEKTKFGKVTANLSKINSLVSTLINRSATAERDASKANTLLNQYV